MVAFEGRGMPRRIKYRLALELLEPRLALNSYFVSPGGNDNNPGTNALPWQTLQHAANQVVAGDTVTVRAGTYAGFVLGWDFPQNGTAASPITFQADPGVIINSKNIHTADGIDLEGTSYVVVKGFQVENPAGGTITRAGIRAVSGTTNAQGVVIENSLADNCGTWGIFTSHEDGILIQNNTCSNTQVQHGIYVSNACVNPVVRANTVFGNHDAGIHMNGDLSQGGNGLIVGALVEDNIIHDNGVGGASGINCDGVQSSIIRNNLLYNNHASGISLYQTDAAGPAINNIVVNNTILMASDARWALNIQNASIGNTVFNNILYNASSFRGSIAISADSLLGFASNYNVVMNSFSPDGGNNVFDTFAQWKGQTGQDVNSLISTPSALFVNAAGNDYHLSATSPAIDAGAILFGIANAPTVDIAGTSRPQGKGWDIGAYEFVPSSPPPPIPGLVGRVATSGQWWVALSNGSNGFTNALWAAWNPNVTWVDVNTGDFNGDGKTDIIGRVLQTGQWYVGLNTGASFNTTLWATWNPNVTWVDVKVGDFNGDGKSDITGRWLQAGSWWTGISNGSSFSTTQWGSWNPNVTWVDVNVGDFNGDGKSDITGRYLQGGSWWTAISTGSSFNTSQWASWNPNATWVDVKVGDFNGDGKADIVGRYLQAGAWYVGLSNGSTAFTTTWWATWSTGVAWVDVQVGDFNGDGKSDIAGRALQLGQWWDGISSGSGFTTSLWATWSTGVNWVDVQTGDFNGDGKADITGRAMQTGQWWTGISNGRASYQTSLWDTWSAAATWVDVRVASKL
jgi:hypothetical protein